MISFNYSIALLTLALAIPVTTSKVATASIPLVQNNPNPTQLIIRAKQLYQDQQYVEASRVWQQAIAIYKQQGDILNQAMALSNLALTQQKLGNWQGAESAIASSLELLQTLSQTATQQRILANTLDIRGSNQRSQGQSQIAFETWERAAKIYQELDNDRAVVKNKINQAQALQDLGYYRRASQILKSIQTTLTDEPDSLEKVSVLLNFGNILRATGNIEQSQVVLQQAGKLAEQLEAKHHKSAILLSLGNTVRALGNRARESQIIQTVNLSSPRCLADSNPQNISAYYLQAADCYQQAALSLDPETKIKAQLNLLSLAVENQDQEVISQQLGISIPELISNIKTNLAQLPATRTTIFDRLNLAQSLICLQPNTIKFSSPITQQCQPLLKPNLEISWQEIEQQIQIALQQANQLQDKPAQAYALGYLGGVYQQTGRLTQAQQLTQQALLTIDNATAPEITYLWQWQLGRIYQLKNQPERALQAYNATFEILQSLKQNLVAINPEVQFAFRDQIEPVYREQVALLLQNNPSQENLRQARDTIEALQLAELNNFFREACLDAKPQKIEDIDPKAAVIYSIILPDRLAVILSQPEQPLQYYQTFTNPQEIDLIFEDLYANLSPFLSPTNPLQPNQTFYNWLIRPLETKLEQNDTNTLVFILDGVMRGIPVASLHDGEQYLVEKYNLALTPGLQLLTSRSLTSSTLETIAGGLTQSRQGFTSLPSVEAEVSEIATLVPSEILLDENFTRDRLQTQVTTLPYPIVHLATHGQFSSRAEDTFLLTWDDRINVKDLDQLLQQRDFAEDIPIELLILSACQTAVGDKQAALGLAGVAVRSGARSTVATLWSVQDDSTAELMTELYQALKTPDISKAQALRQAQLSLLRSSRYQHPFYWSAFILVGNWF
ncbi:MAG: CHAT domain-containing protein [Xenococcaceae cyanobacterium MO_167.B27]|nr:CHAT domain-containing protein [Xenococcaceae cyanobacterium MO_167.B27]